MTCRKGSNKIRYLILESFMRRLVLNTLVNRAASSLPTTTCVYSSREIRNDDDTMSNLK